MKAVSPENEERLRDLEELPALAPFLSTAERDALRRDCDPGLRRPHGFLRFLLFLFGAICLGGTVGFAAWILGVQRGGISVFLLIAGIAAAAGGDVLVTQYRFYRHGLEEAALVGGAALIVAGIVGGANLAFHPSSAATASASLALAGTAGLLLFARYGFFYALIAGAAAIASTPAPFATGGLRIRCAWALAGAAAFAIGALWERRAAWRFDRARARWFQSAALLAVCGVLNLRWGGFGSGLPFAGVPRWFYWFTYGAGFLIPVGALAFGVRRRSRSVFDAAAIALLGAIATNKDYWGRVHQPWDPALLGLLLTATALLLLWTFRRSPVRERGGFTSKKNRELPSGAGLAAAGTAAWSLAPAPSAPGGMPGSGGSSGGAGAGRGY